MKFTHITHIRDITKRNYIPHKTPRHSNYNTWKLSYKNHLVKLYGIFAVSINDRYDNDINWDDDEVFEKFCKFTYDCSSKYISPWNKIDIYNSEDNGEDNGEDI
jgi:hypothetical protein